MENLNKNSADKPYVDGFVLPIPKAHLETYVQVSNRVAEVWKSYGAIDYREFVGDDLYLKGVGSFVDTLKLSELEVVIFGWVTFPSREIRDLANRKVPMDPQMKEIMAPLTKAHETIFDARRMVYGGFKSITF